MKCVNPYVQTRVLSRLTDDDVKAIAEDPRSEDLASETLLEVLKKSVGT